MNPYARSIIKQVAARHGVDEVDICRPNRTPKVFRARVEVSQILDRRGYSSAVIGAILNHDHTTILFYIGKLARKPTKPKPPKVKIAKPPAKKRWHRPAIRHLKCKGCLLCVTPDIRARRRLRGYLVPYAGADMTDYHWKEIRS